jgi:N-methylhydantoinase B
VLTDFLNGYISKQGARDDYGVVIDDRDQIDLKATDALRQTIRAEAKAEVKAEPG